MRSQFSKSAFLQVKEYTLDNELTIWLNEDHSQPKIFGAVVVKAGARDCPNTGIAHYFEHMMFKGTDKIGTTDYKAEKILLDNIADKYDILAESGRQRYMVMDTRGNLNGKYSRILREGFVSMDMAQNILVIKTVSGMAMAVAAALDAIHFHEIVGCIAGDDTIMCAVRSADDTILVMDKIKQLMTV